MLLTRDGLCDIQSNLFRRGREFFTHPLGDIGIMGITPYKCCRQQLVIERPDPSSLMMNPNVRVFKVLKGFGALVMSGTRNVRYAFDILALTSLQFLR